MLILSDRQAEQLCGGTGGGGLAGARSQRGGMGLGRFSTGSELQSFQSIENTINQLNFAINIAVGGSTIINNQVNALSLEATL